MDLYCDQSWNHLLSAHKNPVDLTMLACDLWTVLRYYIYGPDSMRQGRVRPRLSQHRNRNHGA